MGDGAWLSGSCRAEIRCGQWDVGCSLGGRAAKLRNEDEKGEREKIWRIPTWEGGFGL
jgi:hypothetical protein